MELKDFISKSIQDICYGIRDAKKEISTQLNNYPIAPAFFDGQSVLNKHQVSIDFDIAVSTSEVDANTKNGKITIKVVDGGLSQSNEKSMETINRLKFSVPFFPQALNPPNKNLK